MQREGPHGGALRHWAGRTSSPRVVDERLVSQCALPSRALGHRLAYLKQVCGEYVYGGTSIPVLLSRQGKLATGLPGGYQPSTPPQLAKTLPSLPRKKRKAGTDSVL